MWFRIETEKDGTIRRCEMVDQSFRDGNNVYYIEAASKEGAISELGKLVRARKKAGTCLDCGARRQPGSKLCKKHKEFWDAQKRKPSNRQRDPSEEDRASLARLREYKRCLSVVRDAYNDDPAGFLSWISEEILRTEDRISVMREPSDQAAE